MLVLVLSLCALRGALFLPAFVWAVSSQPRAIDQKKEQGQATREWENAGGSLAGNLRSHAQGVGR